MSSIFSLIMAGGSGTRLWPRSRDKNPKQFLSLFSEETLLQSSVNRFADFIPDGNIFLISKLIQKVQVEKQNLSVSRENLLYEPVGKNTLPCIGLAMLFLQRKDPDGIVIVSPSDHLVENQQAFRETILTACGIAEQFNGIVTIGITPSYPATGFGYIQADEVIEFHSNTRAFKVKRFVEKPGIITAREYCLKGNYFWNSGIFVFKCSVLWDSMRKFSPEIYNSLTEIDKYIGTSEYNEQLGHIYSAINSISIDYAILEKADNVYVVKADFVWNDLGSWEQVYEKAEKDKSENAVAGQAILEDSNNCFVYSQNGLIALLGVDDLLVVQEGNATLVCKKGRSEEIKKLVDRMKATGYKDYV